MKSGPLQRSKRYRQSLEIIKVIKKKKELLECKQNAKVGVIIAGDLNDLPSSSPLNNFLNKNNNLNLKSAFHDEPFTVYHKFPLIFGLIFPFKGTIDYILHSTNLVVAKKLVSPRDEEVGNRGLLTEKFPSDHLNLFCEFVFI